MIQPSAYLLSIKTKESPGIMFMRVDELNKSGENTLFPALTSDFR